jgi:hypothetical protein
MSATPVVDAVGIQPAGATRVRVRDGRSTRRWVTAACMIIAPGAVAVVRAVIPYGGTPSETLAGYLTPAYVYPILGIAEVAAVFTMVFAMLGLGRLIQARTPLLALIGTPLAALGWSMIAVLGTMDSVYFELAKASHGGAIGPSLFVQFQANPEIGMFVGLFILGHLVGTLLLGIGLLVSRRIPIWAAMAVIAGDVLHPFAFLVLGSHALDALAYMIMGAGMAMAARAVIATPNDEWDLAPRPAVRT